MRLLSSIMTGTEAEKIVSEQKEFIMPSKCSDGIDFLHMDKGKIVGIGNYGTGMLDLKREDMACIYSKTADRPLVSLSVKVKNDGTVDYFSVDHHGLPIQTLPDPVERWFRMPFLAYTLTGQKGVRFDLGFKGNSKCSFDGNVDDPYKVYATNRQGQLTYNFATQQVINCDGEEKIGEAFHTIDKLEEKKRIMDINDSIISEFLDADKFKDNKIGMKFPNGGEMTFTPFYFTEQWWMIRSGAQLKEKTQFPVYDDNKSKKKRSEGSGLIEKFKRLDREVDFLYGNGEKTTLVDISGKDGVVNGEKIGSDPNTYPINKAFIDPLVIESVEFDSPRNYKAKSVKVTLKPGTECEMRSNFKRRPSTIKDDILFCTDLSGIETKFHDRARKLQTEYMDQVQRNKAEKKEYKQQSKEKIKEEKRKHE